MAKSNQINKSNNFLSQIRLGESYTSLLLGAVVVIVVLFLFLSFFKGKNILTQETGSTSTENEQNSQLGMNKKTYVVKESDNLWHIAENLYGSGYNWVDLAGANNLSNPSLLYVGTNLKVPNVKKREITLTQNVEQEVVIKGSSYVVVKGDYLWNIAIRAYGDGYRWTEIAKANSLINPDVIQVGLVLKLPR